MTKPRNNQYSIDAPPPSKAQQQEENKRLMEEFEAKHGKVETDPIKPVTVQSIKDDNKRAFSGANKAGYKSPGRNRKDK